MPECVLKFPVEVLLSEVLLSEVEECTVYFLNVFCVRECCIFFFYPTQI